MSRCEPPGQARSRLMQQAGQDAGFSANRVHTTKARVLADAATNWQVNSHQPLALQHWQRIKAAIEDGRAVDLQPLVQHRGVNLSEVGVKLHVTVFEVTQAR